MNRKPAASQSASRSGTDTIRVLSVQQPHADLIIYGGKWCENRSWHTRYRGELFIHASSLDRAEMKRMLNTGIDPVESSPGGCRTGAIIGSVVLHDCVPLDDVEYAEAIINDPQQATSETPDSVRALADLLRTVHPSTWSHVGGEVCWILTNPRALVQPIDTKGKLNLWSFEAPVAALRRTPAPGRRGNQQPLFPQVTNPFD